MTIYTIINTVNNEKLITLQIYIVFLTLVTPLCYTYLFLGESRVLGNSDSSRAPFLTILNYKFPSYNS